MAYDSTINLEPPNVRADTGEADTHHIGHLATPNQQSHGMVAPVDISQQDMEWSSRAVGPLVDEDDAKTQLATDMDAVS